MGRHQLHPNLRQLQCAMNFLGNREDSDVRARQLAFIIGPAVLVLANTATAWAHVRPQTSDPAPGARLDNPPAHVTIMYDGVLAQSGSSITLLDSSGNVVPTAPDPARGRQASISPASEMAPGPYTVDWVSVDPEDGHSAQGFYTFVVNGGPVGIIAGDAQSQIRAGDLLATLTVTAASDGSSMLRVDLDNNAAVERVRIRLSRPDLGEDLLDTRPSGDGGWLLAGNEVAQPGAWHADVVIRRTNVFEDAQGGFDFTVDSVTGAPAFTSASTAATQ